jgi:hypothetical protein
MSVWLGRPRYALTAHQGSQHESISSISLFCCVDSNRFYVELSRSTQVSDPGGSCQQFFRAVVKAVAHAKVSSLGSSSSFPQTSPYVAAVRSRRPQSTDVGCRRGDFHKTMSIITPFVSHFQQPISQPSNLLCFLLGDPTSLKTHISLSLSCSTSA